MCSAPYFLPERFPLYGIAGTALVIFTHYPTQNRYALLLEMQSCFAPHCPTQNRFALLLEMLHSGVRRHGRRHDNGANSPGR
ncbi:hypothetical protein F9K79_20065 [Ochrobactrum sp. Kaboul]|nr:hypothetical protein F9K79_20065 [Ochrobactrum sp. Kaboul]